MNQALPGFDEDPADLIADAIDDLLGPVPRPVNWRTLDADEAEEEWLALNAWVEWLRRDFGLQANVIPPLWHRHWEMVWELSALRSLWLLSYDPQGSAGAPISWLREFELARQRWRQWVAEAGTRVDRDRETRIAVWPGEPERTPIVDNVIANRDQDFVDWVHHDIRHRRSRGQPRP